MILQSAPQTVLTILSSVCLQNLVVSGGEIATGPWFTSAARSGLCSLELCKLSEGFLFTVTRMCKARSRVQG